MNAVTSAQRATPSAPIPAALRDKRMADALRMLAVDAVDRAKSGHPGAPMGMAEMAVALWSRHLQHNPATRAGPIATVSC